VEENKEQQELQMIKDMDQHCQNEIRKTEKKAGAEREERKEKEKLIHQLRSQGDPKEIFEKLLEKSIYFSAREKGKQDKLKKEDETQDAGEKDYLGPILQKLNLQDKELDEESAIHVKNEALKNLKDRLLTRAEIIQRRLQDEQKALETAFASLKRKGESVEDKDT
jgi:hypothetical protein